MKKFYQVCYGKPNNNWKSFNCSPDATTNVVSFFEKNAINNTPQNFDYSKLGENENLCEIVCFDRFIETSRTKYGMVDNFGRPMMFSNGFVFDAYDKWLENPNNILALSEDNFHFSIEETANIPDVPKYNSPFSMETAKSITKLNDDQIKMIMGCVNLSFASSINYPTYLVFSGTTEEKKALMFIIISLIPYSLRYQICISNANNFQYSMNKTFMIVDEIPESGQYIDVRTSSGNIELGIIEEDNKYPFLAALFEYGVNSYDRYCKELAEEANEIGLPYICDYDDLIYADLILRANFKSIQKKNDTELTKFLLDISAKVPIGNLTVDQFVSKLLKIYIERKIEPNEVLLNRIKVRNDKTECKDLQAEYKHLQMLALVNSGEEKTVDFLREEKSRNINAFEEWAKYIINSNGENCVNKYYSSEIANATSFQQIKDLWSERKELISDNSIDSETKERLHYIALNELFTKSNVKDSFNEIIEEYTQTYFEMFGEENEPLELQDSLFSAFWDKYVIDDFEFSDEYCVNLKEIKSINKKVYAPSFVEYLLRLQESIIFASKDNGPPERQMLEDEFRCFNDYTELTESLRNKLSEYVLSVFSNCQNKHLIFWYKLAKIRLKEDETYKAFDRMIDWHLDVLLVDYEFENSLDGSRIGEYINELIYIIEGSKWQLGYLDNCDSKDERYKLMKSRLSQLKSKQKQLKKEMKRSEKESDDEGSSGKKGFSFFKKK